MTGDRSQWAVRLASFTALNIPVYRELYARVGAAIASLLGVDRAGAEGILRGFCHRRFGDARRLTVGRHVVFIEPRRMDFGERVSFYGFNYLNAGGPSGSITIGSMTHVDVGSVLYGQGGLRIGAGCAIAAGVVIYSQSNQYRSDPARPILEQPVRYAPVEIGDDVWIGANVSILPGVTIGRGAVVGAGAVVREAVSEYAIVAGVPARVIGTRCP